MLSPILIITITIPLTYSANNIHFKVIGPTELTLNIAVFTFKETFYVTPDLN